MPQSRPAPSSAYPLLHYCQNEEDFEGIVRIQAAMPGYRNFFCSGNGKCVYTQRLDPLTSTDNGVRISHIEFLRIALLKTTKNL